MVRTPFLPLVNGWRFPRQPVLLGQRLASGPPPFGPVLTPTYICDAWLCPLAAYYSLLSDIHPLPERRGRRWSSGTTYHRMIARLRGELAGGQFVIPGGSRVVQEQAVRQRIFEMAREMAVDQAFVQELWSTAIEPYVARKLASGELTRLRGNDLITEVAVLCPDVQVPTNDGGHRTYPFHGVIDELDASAGRLIERTIRGDPQDNEAPGGKDLQARLLRRILSSISLAERPEGWERTDWEVIVETPFKDFSISVDSSDTVAIHEGAAWADLICRDPRIWRACLTHAQCSPTQSHLGTGDRCPAWRRRPPYPRSRQQLLRDCAWARRLLMYEYLWRHDLFWYRIMLQTAGQLGLLVPIQVTGMVGDRILLDPASPVGNPAYALVVFGTVALGLYRAGDFEDVGGGRLAFLPSDPLWGWPRMGAFPMGQAALLIFPEPTFLIHRDQRLLTFLPQRGVYSAQEAETSGHVVLFEALHGLRDLETRS